MPGAGTGSPRARRGTSATTITTAPTTPGRSTSSATGARQPTARRAGASDEPSPATGSVTAAVRRDLAQIAVRDADLAQSALAASALAMAAELDTSGNSATSKAMCAKALLDTLDRIRELLPPEQEADRLDDLSARRAARLAGGSAAPG